MEKPTRPLREKFMIKTPPSTQDKILASKIYVYSSYSREEDEWRDEEINDWDYDIAPFSLQEMINLVPKGINPKDVFVSIYRDRAIKEIIVSVKFKEPVDKESWKAEYQRIESDYKKEYESYIEKLDEYNLWKARQELQKAQDNLNKLENK